MIVLPRLPPNPTPADLARWADDLVRSLQAVVDQVTAPATGRDATGKPTPYQATPVTQRRTLTVASAPTLTAVADCLATVVADLKARGVLL